MLLQSSLSILSPFLAAFVWATMIVVATWPMMRRLERACGGRRTPAVIVMSAGLLAILFVPLIVALGVVVTALVQSALGGIGLAIVGVPFAGVLTAIMFALCIAQLGPIIVLLGATVWAYSSLGAGWGTFMLVWALVVGLMDNFLRPMLIKRGADLPLLLIFAGVIGGLVAFGVIGIFVGPVLLAVAYTLLDNWVATAPPLNIASPAAIAETSRAAR